jgi:LacI family transcriptional regulator
MSQRITMLDIARHLDLDQSTVSLALRNHPRISAVTRDKVHHAAATLGYRPDPMLSALATYRQAGRPHDITAELAWVNRWSSPEKFHAFREFDGYWRGAMAAARDGGYRLETFNLGDAPLSRLERILRARNITGLVIPPHHGGCNEWSGMDFSGFNIVRIGHSVRLAAHAVGCDQTAAAILGFNRIHARGYRRIGFVTHPGAEVSSRFRAGFLFAQENTSDHVHLPTLLLQEKDVATDRNDLACWLKHHRPDAILTTSAPLRGLLADLGVRVPHDIALAGTSVLDGNAEAGIDQRPEEIGRAAIELIESLFAHGHRGVPEVPRMVTVASRWVDGASLPARSVMASTV